MRSLPVLGAIAGWFEDDLFRRLLQNAGWLLSGTVIATALGLGGTVIKARALGLQLFGVLAVVTAYVAVVERLATFQPWLALIKYGAEALEKKRPDEFMGLVKMSVALDLLGAISGMALAILGAFALAGRWGWDSQISHMAAVLGVGILLNLSGTPTGILRLLDRFRMFAVQKVLTACLGLGGAVVVYIAGYGIWGFLIVTLVSGIIGNLFLLGAGVVALRQRGLWWHWRAPVTVWKPFLRFSGWTYATSTLDIPIRQLDILIVSALTSFEVTGIYKMIKQICGLLTEMADPLYQAVYPQFAAMVAVCSVPVRASEEVSSVKLEVSSSDPALHTSHFHLDTSRETPHGVTTSRLPARYAVKVGAVIAAVIGPVALMLAVFSPWWLGVVFGGAFAAGWLPLSAFLMVTVLSVSCIAIHPLFLALGYVKENAIVLLIANAVYLVCAWLLTSAIGLVGLAAASGIQLALVVGLKAVYIRVRSVPARASKGIGGQGSGVSDLTPADTRPLTPGTPHGVITNAAEIRA
jgi:O-antigen/teichoic acid export membrane protein